MSLPRIQLEGRVAADPTLRFASSGTAIGGLRVVADERKKNESTGEWETSRTCWVNVTLFKQEAENMVESISKGDLVIVTGRLETREYETQGGEKRTSVDVIADSVSPSLKWSVAKPVKAERTQGSSSGSQASTSTRMADKPDDPWATPAGQSDEPPF